MDDDYFQVQTYEKQQASGSRVSVTYQKNYEVGEAYSY